MRKSSTSCLRGLNKRVAITEGIMCPRFCRYSSDFRPVNCKSGVSFKKNVTKECPSQERCPYKSILFFLAYGFFKQFFFLGGEALNFHNTFVGPCWGIFDIFCSEMKVFFLDGPGTLVTFVVNLKVHFFSISPAIPGIPKFFFTVFAMVCLHTCSRLIVSLHS